MKTIRPTLKSFRLIGLPKSYKLEWNKSSRSRGNGAGL